MKKELQEYLDSHTPGQLRAELFKREHLQKIDDGGGLVPLSRLSWWRKDRFGWPIETYKDRPFKSFVRLVFQNIRKVTG